MTNNLHRQGYLVSCEKHHRTFLGSAGGIGGYLLNSDDILIGFTQILELSLKNQRYKCLGGISPASRGDLSVSETTA